jgi:hypothetical protein
MDAVVTGVLILVASFVVRLVVLSVWDAWRGGPKWQKRVQRKHAVKSRAAEVQTLQQVKRERFVQQEREWLLDWIKTDETGMGDVRRRWYKSNAYWCIDGLSAQQQQKLEDHLIYWARRRAENLSQYGPGGWDGTGWERPESTVAAVNREGAILPRGLSGPTVVPHKQFLAEITKDVAAELAAQRMAVDAKAAELQLLRMPDETVWSVGEVQDVSDEEEEQLGQQILEMVTARWRI